MLGSVEGAKGWQPQPHPPGHDRPSYRRLRPPSMRRRRTPSPGSGVELMTGSEGYRTAYDAYHDTTFTLAPIHGVPPRPADGSVARTDDGNTTANSGIGHRHQLLAAKDSLPAATTLDYQDFAPRLTGFDDSGNVRCLDTFPDLVTRANEWLRQNPQMMVKTCETITWSTSRVIEVGDTEGMVLQQQCSANQCHPAAGDDIYYFTGLRLWVIPETVSSRRSPSNPVEADTTSGVNASDASNGDCGHFLRYRDYKPTKRNSLPYLIDRVNEDLTTLWPLEGVVTTVETNSMPEYLSTDTSLLFWKQSESQPHRALIFLRLFYQTVPHPRPQKIGVKNFVPICVGPTYEPFSRMFQRATSWLRSQSPPVRLTNVKSYNISFNRGSIQSALEDEANRCIHASSTCPSFSHPSAEASQYFQVLRLFYVIHASSDDVTSAVDSRLSGQEDRPEFACDEMRPRPSNIRCALFSPFQTSAGVNIRATFERMKQTTLRISSWVQQSVIDVHSIETYTGPLLPSMPNHCLPELTLWTHQSMTSKHRPNDKKFLMHIRVYFESRPTTPQLQENHHNQHRYHHHDEPPTEEPSVIIPPICCPIPGAVESAIAEEQRKFWEGERRRRNRKLRLILSCSLFLAVCIPAAALFYLNAVQTPD